MLRTWQDVIAKWELTAGEDEPGAGEAADAFARGRSALLAGRLDDALGEFERSAALRAHPHDHVGIGDVLLARGRWRAAARHYRRAEELDPGNALAFLGLSQAKVAGSDAVAAAEDLERVYGGSDDPVLRYYLASTWCSVADQARHRAGDETLVFTSEGQLALCEHAARRILELDVDDRELRRGAERLLAEVRSGRRWHWRPEGIAVSLAVLAVSFGLTLVAIGGVTGSVPLVIAGIVVGSALLYLIVVRFRRQSWRARAELPTGGIRGGGA
ncbi:tetratricopeptide repeat protein [Actinokineospora iranica]|uniref:Uncharacterized protein n=1 Tax=Actinokineospora iranica TaxID=1271860 RepID=A0A1G6M6T9_9PSEU|nr:tetratricopeptide repeat protein [Actinokineospora iranica]SDC51024.1 hypothetical protein SAMN05216174_102393 [Actinokineospora iranica]